jgi:hypothetical protein
MGDIMGRKYVKSAPPFNPSRAGNQDCRGIGGQAEGGGLRGEVGEIALTGGVHVGEAGGDPHRYAGPVQEARGAEMHASGIGAGQGLGSLAFA